MSGWTDQASERLPDDYVEQDDRGGFLAFLWFLNGFPVAYDLE